MGNASLGMSRAARLAATLSGVVVSFAATSVYAIGLTVGAGGTTSLADGTMDLDCGDLVIEAGATLNMDSGTLFNVDNVVINGGMLNGGSGTINISGDWTNNAGTTNPGTSKVIWNTNCHSDTINITGDSSFWDLSIKTDSGRMLVFGAGSTTSVGGYLEMNGAGDEDNPANLLRIKSSVGGSPAFLFVNGTYNIFKVNVSDNHATFPGAWIDYGYPEDFDSIDGPGNSRWFRSGPDEGTITFHVTKSFDDANPATVTANISCNYGLPLIQEQDISNVQDVTFIVTSVDSTDQGPDCRIWEESYPGYTGSYALPAAPNECNEFTETCSVVNTGDKQGCFYDNVHPGEGRALNTCNITNNLDPVLFSITKEWVSDGVPNDSNISTKADITLSCNAVALGAPSNWNWVIYGDDEIEQAVYPRWQGNTVCTVSEKIPQSGVESSGCDENYKLLPGQGAECVLTNTMFYEGIPTLSDLGLAIMALLMLGVGLIGFRRVV